MLDTADIRHFVIPKIRETILYINRYETIFYEYILWLTRYIQV